MITVLTPAYNRAHTLERLFESLCNQSTKTFEWLLIDDGSTDQTKSVFNALSAKGDFSSRYVFQENAGKHSAVNAGVKAASGNWILILDSDDALTNDAIATISTDIETHNNVVLSGLCYRKAYFNHEFIGEGPTGEKPTLMHPSEAGRRFRGDLAYVFRTEALRAHPFPVIEGERFVPELYIWNKIGDDGRIIFFPDSAIYLCEYLSDGYTANFQSNLRKNPKGFGLFYRSQFFREPSLIGKAKCALRAAQCFVYAASRRID